MLVYKSTFFVIALLSLWIIVPDGLVHAQVPVVVTQESLNDVFQISEPDVAQAFHGMLTGFPHTYEVRAREPFTLFVEVWVPDTEGAQNTLSSIVIHETGNKGRVEEVTRLLSRDASWDTFFNTGVGERYRRGGQYKAELSSGVYRIEMSTPDNLSPYVLRVGTEEDAFTIGYLERIGRIAEVKHFFGKSSFWIITSPYVYIPLLILLVAVCGYRYRQKIKHSSVGAGTEEMV